MFPFFRVQHLSLSRWWRNGLRAAPLRQREYLSTIVSWQRSGKEIRGRIFFGSKQAYWEHGSLPRCDCPPRPPPLRGSQSAVRGPHGGGDMKISDAVIDLRTDWHPRIARFLEGNAGRAGRVAQDNPGHSARGPKRATERKTKARPASPASLIRVGIPVFAKRKSPRRRGANRPCPDSDP